MLSRYSKKPVNETLTSDVDGFSRHRSIFRLQRLDAMLKGDRRIWLRLGRNSAMPRTPSVLSGDEPESVDFILTAAVFCIRTNRERMTPSARFWAGFWERWSPSVRGSTCSTFSHTSIRPVGGAAPSSRIMSLRCWGSWMVRRVTCGRACLGKVSRFMSPYDCSW